MPDPKITQNKMEEQQQHIIDTALDLFREYGFKHVTIDDVARKGHVSKKTIYRYFANKRHIINSTIENTGVLLKKRIATETVNEHDYFQFIFRIYFNFFEEPDVLAFFKENSLKQYYREQYLLLTETLLKLFQDYTKEQIDKGIGDGIFISDLNTKELCILFVNGLIMTMTEEVSLIKKGSTGQSLLMNQFTSFSGRLRL